VTKFKSREQAQIGWDGRWQAIVEIVVYPNPSNDTRESAHMVVMIVRCDDQIKRADLKLCKQFTEQQGI
jgi:hypothetical protein